MNATANRDQPNWNGLVSFAISVLVYFVVSPISAAQDNPSYIELVVKCTPIICLAYFVIENGLKKEQIRDYSKNILFGLLFSVVGDACLVWDSLFFFGLAAFMFGHIHYIRAFGFTPLKLYLTIPLFPTAMLISQIFFEGVSGILLVAIPIYVIVITLMVWRASARIQQCDFNLRMGTFIGSALFAFSDTLVAISQFKGAFPYGQFIIMSTYYAAQLLIVLSVLEGKPAVRRP